MLTDILDYIILVVSAKFSIIDLEFIKLFGFFSCLQVTGDSIYNLLRIGEVETDKDDRPLDSPPKVLSVEVCISYSV